MPFILGITGLVVASKATNNPILNALAAFATGGLYGLLNQPSRPPPPAGTQVPLKQSYAARQSGFGEVRTGGLFALYEAVQTADSAATAYMAHALLDGRSNRFTRWYFNDDRLTLVDGTDGVHGPDGKKYEYGDGGDRCFFHTRLGLDTETAYADFVSAVPHWTSGHRGDGVTSAGIICKQSKLKFQQEDFPNGLPQGSAAIEAQLVYDPRDGGQTQGDKSTYVYSANPVLCLLAYLTDANGGMGLDYARRFAPTIAYWSAAADDCDANEATSGQHAIVDLAAAAGDTTVTLSNVTGLAHGVVISFPAETATVDSVAGSVVTLTAALTQNQALNYVVTWAADGVEKRYRCAGIYKHDNGPSDVVTNLLASFDGWMGARGDGAIVVYSGRYYAPTITLDDRHVISYSLQHFQTDENAANAFQVSYTDPDSEFTTVDAGQFANDDDIAARGVRRVQPLDLGWVPSAGQAGRLGKRTVNRATQDLRGTIVTTLYGIKALGERYLRLQIAENSALSDIVVEVAKVEIDLARLQLTFDWVEADPTIDDDDPGADVPVPGIPAPRPPSTALEAPTITAVTPVYDDSGSGIAGARLQVDVDAPITADVQWLLRWKTSAGSDWHEGAYTDIDDGAAVVLLTGFVTAAGSVDVQVAYQTAGATSPWSATWTTAIDAPLAGQASATADGALIVGPGYLYDAAGTAKIVQADASDLTKPCNVWILAAALSGAAASYTFGGCMVAVTGKAAGQQYWLDTTPGGLAAAPPAAGNDPPHGSQVIGWAPTATAFWFDWQPMEGI